MAGAGSRGLDIGAAITIAVSTIGRNWVVFGLLGLAFVAAPTVAGTLLVDRLAAVGSIPQGTFLGSMEIAYGRVALTAVVAVVFESAVIYGVTADLNGRRASLGECLSVGVTNWPGRSSPASTAAPT